MKPTTLRVLSFTLIFTALFAGCATRSVDWIAHTEKAADITAEHRAPWAFQETDDAWAALKRKDYVEAARYYSNAVAKGATIRAATPNSGMGDPNDVEYNAARCYAKLGSNELAFRFLNLALAAAPIGDLRRDPDVLRRDPDLVPLHQTREWQRIIRHLTTEREKYLKTVNPRIYELFKDDQLELVFLDWSDQEAVKGMSRHRGERRAELDRILASGQSLSADDDYFCVLLIEHAAKDAADSERSNRLVEEAVKRGCRFPHARWMIATHRDRKLRREQKPQAYGTQVRRDRANGGKWTLEPLDPNAVTDAERRELKVPSLAARRKEIEIWNVQAAKLTDAERQAQANSAYPPKLEGAQAEVYKKIGDTELQLFIFAPEQHKAADSRPAIVFFFGGSWTGGSPKQFEQHCRYFASRGLLAIAADFRVGSRHGTKPVQCVADAKSAIRWVRSNAKRLGVDPRRIAAAGGSSGGHLATAAAFVEGFEDESEDKAVSTAPNALMLFNPVLVLAALDGKELDAFGASFFTSERLGADPVALSPAHHVTAGAPPTIIFHGKADATVPFVTMEMFTEKMKKAGNRCELVGYDGQTHGFFNYVRSDKFFRETLKRADEFLASLGYLSGKPRVEEFFPPVAPGTPKP